MSGWTEIIAWLVLPWLFSTLYKWWTTRRANALQQQDNNRNQWQRIDYFATLFFVIAALIHVASAVWGVPFNFLQVLGKIGPDTPAFVLRNAFRSYMASMFDGWTMGDSNASKFDSATFNTRIGPLEQLYDRLRSVQGRKQYLQYGHESFESCRWCTDDTDYAVFALPSIIISYVTALALLGIGTTARSKAAWRGWGLLCVLAFSALDLFYLFFPSDSLKSMGGLDPSWSQFSYMFKVRHYLLTIIFVIGAMYRASSISGEKETLTGLINTLHQAYTRMNSARLARAAILSDSTLRKAFFEHYKEKEAFNNIMVRDLAFLDAKRKAMSKLNLSQLIDNVRANTNSIMSTAMTNGYLQGVELPALSEDEMVKELLPSPEAQASPAPSDAQGPRRRKSDK